MQVEKNKFTWMNKESLFKAKTKKSDRTIN